LVTIVMFVILIKLIIGEVTVKSIYPLINAMVFCRAHRTYKRSLFSPL